jgi:citrate lyase subunit beta-like protein
MIEKSLSSPADSVAYDLEDAVAPSAKPEARRLVAELLDSDRRPAGEVVARINAVGTGFEVDDLDAVLRARHVQAIALPKTNDPEHIEWVVSRIKALCPPDKQAGKENAVRIIGMIESAEAMVRINEIAAAGRGHLDALLFAAEDCELRTGEKS